MDKSEYGHKKIVNEETGQNEKLKKIITDKLEKIYKEELSTQGNSDPLLVMVNDLKKQIDKLPETHRDSLIQYYIEKWAEKTLSELPHFNQGHYMNRVLSTERETIINLEAKILEWASKTKDTEFMEFFDIKIVREGKIE